jgi:hypothetical protein
MRFNNAPVPTGFNVFRRADEDFTRTFDFSGTADVTLISRDDDNIMTVAVTNLIEASALD